MQSSGSSSSLKNALKKVGSTGSAIRALATGEKTHSHPQQQSSTQNAGIQHGQVMNVHKAVHDYIQKIISSVPGMKALLLDPETTSIVGLVYSQSDMNAKEVFLVESVHTIADGMLEEAAEDAHLRSTHKKGAIMKSSQVGINEQSMQHLKAVVFIQPSSASLQKLGVLLKSPRYKEYHIFFSNIVPEGYLDALADLDVYDSIKQVHEYYADYFVVTPSLLHFNADQQTASKALSVSNVYSSTQSWMYDRDFQGLLSLLLSLKKRSDIRYMSGSEPAKRLALDLVHTMHAENELFTFQGEPTLLLIVDRAEDVVTPLLTQWTYQSMVHELVGIKMNRVLLAEKETPGGETPGKPAAVKKPESQRSDSEKAADALRDVILSSTSDDFFRSSMFVNFGELGIRVKKLVADFQQVTKTQTKLETVEDMQRFVDNYPQFKLQSGTVAKHVSVMEAISKEVNVRKLLTVSAIEQELVCSPPGETEHAEVLDKLFKLLSDPSVRFMDKLRCCILYALRFEHSGYNQLEQLKGILRAYARVSGYDESVLHIIDRVVGVSSSRVRTWPLFTQDSDALSLKSVVRSIQTNVGGVQNIYTQHRSMVHDIVQTLLAGELKTQQFPFAENGSVKTLYRKIIVHVVGGCTYEEYAQVESLLLQPRYRGNFSVLLSGSAIHNSQTFLNQVDDVEAYRMENFSNQPHEHQLHPAHHPPMQAQRHPGGYTAASQQPYPPPPAHHYGTSSSSSSSTLPQQAANAGLSMPAQRRAASLPPEPQSSSSSSSYPSRRAPEEIHHELSNSSGSSTVYQSQQLPPQQRQSRPSGGGAAGPPRAGGAPIRGNPPRLSTGAPQQQGGSGAGGGNPPNSARPAQPQGNRGMPRSASGSLGQE